MGEKDITEKTLEGYNDVFADILNVLLFDGKKVVDPDDLEDQAPRSMYKADGKIHELERDVVKRWKKSNIRIACIGIENQSEPDRFMPIRVAGYDGTEYRAQMANFDEQGKFPYPVITIVLYFGYERHWNQPLTLFEVLDVPEKIQPFVNDLKVNLFEIAYLTPEQVNMFQSDFKVVADYFVQMRENGTYKPSTDELNHIQAVLQLLNTMEKDNRFESGLNEKNGKGQVNNMSEWLDKIITESEARGEAHGGEKGENRVLQLLQILQKQGRTEDTARMINDPEYRHQLYEEFQIA